MADFKQAIRWMKEGEKVRRSKWANNYYIKCVSQTYIEEEGPDHSSSYESKILDFEATDWEYKKDNWNLHSYELSKLMPDEYSQRCYQAMDVETLKEKILQDFADLRIVNVVDNVCYASYIDINDIINKRFGF